MHFGIPTERRFKGATRDHNEHVIKFFPREKKAPIAMNNMEEKSSSPCAFIQVAKITIVPENEVAWIKGKVENLSHNEDKIHAILALLAVGWMEFISSVSWFQGEIERVFHLKFHT